jgi:hypothetical protein
MVRRLYDPLVCISSPDAIRPRLQETLTLAERLWLLLEMSERLQTAEGALALTADNRQGGENE